MHDLDPSVGCFQKRVTVQGSAVSLRVEQCVPSNCSLLNLHTECPLNFDVGLPFGLNHAEDDEEQEQDASRGEEEHQGRHSNQMNHGGKSHRH